MNIFVFCFLCLAAQSGDSLSSDEVKCNIKIWKILRYDSITDDYHVNYVKLSCASLSNSNLLCVKKGLQEKSNKEVIDELRIRNCDIFETRNSIEILKALGLSSMRTINFNDATERNKKVETNVSAEHGAESLIFYLGTEILPDGVFQNYTNLKELKIDIRTLKKVPQKVFANLKQLKKLTWKNLHSFIFERAEIEMLPNLESIIVEFLFDENRCKSFQLDFQNMSQLKDVDLQSTFGNCIEANLFKGARNLEKIFISFNKFLSQLPNELFEDQVNLKELSLIGNGIEFLPSQLFAHLTQLEVLEISLNNLTKIYWTWPLLPKLEVLNLSYNWLYLKELTVVLNSTNFKTIECHECDPNSLQNFRTDAFFCGSDTSCHFSADRNGNECPKGCKCHFERETLDFVINCDNASLTEFPKLPMPTIGNLTVRIENNSIAMLPNNSFYGFANIEKLYASGNHLNFFNSSQISQKLKFIDLSRNQLRTVDVETVQSLEKRKNFLTMKAAANPWICDCELVSFLQLVKKLNNKVLDIGQLKCNYEGQKLTLVEADESLICPSKKTLIAFVTVAFVVMICLIIILYLCYSEQVNIWLYEHNCCLSCIIDDELYKNMVYDAFMSYSTNDADILPQFVENLEKCSNPYKLCIHDRDWLAGDCIPDRISRTVDQSKRIIIILSQNYLNSTWGRMEFRLAIRATLRQRRRRLIIVLYNEPENFDKIDNEMKAYLKLNTYLRWDDPNFWRKLHYAMPQRKPQIRGTRRSEQNNEIEMAYRI